jgi:hypothetical protein
MAPQGRFERPLVWLTARCFTAWLPGNSNWHPEKVSNFQPAVLEAAALPVELSGHVYWRLMPESNRRLFPRQGNTLAAELMRRCIAPVTGSGAAQSLRPVCANVSNAGRIRFLYWRTAGVSIPSLQIESLLATPAWRFIKFHFGCVHTRRSA